MDIEGAAQKFEEKRVVFTRKVISREIREDGSVVNVTMSSPEATVSPLKFVKLSVEFCELMAYEASCVMSVFFVVCSELASYRFADSVYLHHHESMSRSTFNKGIAGLIKIGLLAKTENPHIYLVNRNFIEFGKKRS